MAQRGLDEGVRIAHKAAPQLRAHERLASGSPQVVLMNQSHRAALAVIGAHGVGVRPGALRDWPLVAVYGCWEPEAITTAEANEFTSRAEFCRLARCTVCPARWRSFGQVDEEGRSCRGR
jgi:hypothetical protein